ncbi:zinc-dependent peptidase [Formosa sp. Hel1_31_208]|uniref:zinc-dependent peptidase n=1 Tax=Formosa sp. Hel1_31_208 TaxID=1798225 RepID=UPI001E5D166A|nr:zinc-dependent peptidase [Formosa sp. Hel1_31_208]
MAYVEYINKSLFVNHIYFNKQKLSKDQRSVLKRQFKFYQKLSLTHQSYFEHRVFMVIKNMEFIGKDLEVTQEMKVMISATLVKLTFGLRDYRIKSVERIIFYPDEFYSQTNKAYHKGEFNLGYKALVFSWKDVLHGYDIEDDNLNLAVHEFTHAIHFYFMRVRHRSTSAAIFLNAYVELTTMLDKNPKLKSKLIKSQFLREYAFTNQFEFLSVVIETFIESPDQFKSQFPQIYMKVKTMLNFNFAGY